jgi:exodeoxyribonuclease VII small subunit
MKSELDDVLVQLQDENIGIDKSLALYERGLELIKLLEEYLKTSENKISEIKAKFNITEK